MKGLGKIFGNWWVVSLGLAALAALILCLILPLAVPALDRLLPRLLLLLLVLAVWGVFAVIRAVAANRASARIARSLLEEELATGEQRALAKRMSDALAKLKAS
jgi:type VI secretion system protein ImpL